MSANLQREPSFNPENFLNLAIAPQLTREGILEFPQVPLELPKRESSSGLDCALREQDLMMKRIVDMVLASVALVIFFVPMAIIAMLVKLNSKGPIFYGQRRVGLGGKSFTMWKFRSMRVGAEDETGAVWAVENDPRRTRFGAFLRTTSLDELPQLWNVLKGEMSLVGPRPERPEFVAEFRKTIPSYMERHRVPVGITGWAQIHGWRGNTSLQVRVSYDIYYLKNWTLIMDLKILVLTLFRGFINRNAY